MPLEFRPKYEKIVELLLYLAHKRPGADKYQAVKFFYLADREHLNRYGRPITQEHYFALPYGPVAETALDLLNGKFWAFKKAGIKALPFRTEEGRVAGQDVVYIREPKRAVDLDLFSKSDLKVFDEILAKYGDKSFKQLYDLTHDHAAYRKAWGRRGLWKRAAMQYEEMIDSPELRARIIEDIGPVSAHM